MSETERLIAKDAQQTPGLLGSRAGTGLQGKKPPPGGDSQTKLEWRLIWQTSLVVAPAMFTLGLIFLSPFLFSMQERGSEFEPEHLPFVVVDTPSWLNFSLEEAFAIARAQVMEASLETANATAEETEAKAGVEDAKAEASNAEAAAEKAKAEAEVAEEKVKMEGERVNATAAAEAKASDADEKKRLAEAKKAAQEARKREVLKAAAAKMKEAEAKAKASAAANKEKVAEAKVEAAGAKVEVAKAKVMAAEAKADVAQAQKTHADLVAQLKKKMAAAKAAKDRAKEEKVKADAKAKGNSAKLPGTKVPAAQLPGRPGQAVPAPAVKGLTPAAILTKAKANAAAANGGAPPGSMEAVFSTPYKKGEWWKKSGADSTIEYTANVRRFLGVVFDALKIKSLLDSPCGDCHWQPQIPGFDNLSYTGVDIVKAVIEENQERFKNKTNMKFLKLNLILTRPPGTYNAVLSRDMAQHLPLGAGMSAYKAIEATGAKYLLTTFHSSCAFNEDIPAGKCRFLDLMKPPFNFSMPMMYAMEGIDKCKDPKEKFHHKMIGLWKLPALRRGTGGTFLPVNNESFKGKFVVLDKSTSALLKAAKFSDYVCHSAGSC